jgi:hypothetical protein
MSTNIPTGNGGVSGSECQQLSTKSKGSRSRESQIDDVDDYYGIEAMRKKLILDLGIEVKIMRNKVFRKNEKAKEKQLLASSTAVAADGYPWKLRSKTNVIEEIKSRKNFVLNYRRVRLRKISSKWWVTLHRGSQTRGPILFKIDWM